MLLILASVFQIHAPSRERRDCISRVIVDGTISIHAPSRERLFSDDPYYRNPNFNPRSLTGATFINCQIWGKSADFNPRSLTGATLVLLPLMVQNTISIHAPSRERQACFCSVPHKVLFQSTLPHGSDTSNVRNMIVFQHFNPRSLTGATVVAAVTTNLLL